MRIARFWFSMLLVLAILSAATNYFFIRYITDLLMVAPPASKTISLTVVNPLQIQFEEFMVGATTASSVHRHIYWPTLVWGFFIIFCALGIYLTRPRVEGEKK